MCRTLEHLFVGVVLLGVTAMGLASSASAKPAPEEQTGLAVGQPAPDFTLKDQHGRDVSLDDLRRGKKVALVFFRSAGWCPICMKQLVELQRKLEDIEATGTQLVGISYDSVETLKKFSDRVQIEFPLLADQGSRVIEAFGILRRDVKEGSVEDGIPYPGIYLIDTDGIVRAKFFEEGYVRRPTAQDIIDAAKKVD